MPKIFFYCSFAFATATFFANASEQVANDKSTVKASIQKQSPSPDDFALVERIRAKILATQQEKSEAHMKDYTTKVPKIGKEFSMVALKGGDFTMGSPESEPGRKADEGPQVKVTVHPFWIGTHEVTWDLYMPFMLTPEARFKDGSKKKPSPSDSDVEAVSSPTMPYTDMTFGLGKEGFPAISATEHAANKYCQWLSAQTGEYYRLPTEAEWEYAARAGTTTAYFFGDNPADLHDYAWYQSNSDKDGKGICSTSKVGTKKPNPWGIYDILGNVNEWTIDQYAVDFYAKLATGLQPVLQPLNRPTTLYPRVVRGGGFQSTAENCRTAKRRASTKQWKLMDPQLPQSRWYHTNAEFLGFRIVRPLLVPDVKEMHFLWNFGILK